MNNKEEKTVRQLMEWDLADCSDTNQRDGLEEPKAKILFDLIACIIEKVTGEDRFISIYMQLKKKIRHLKRHTEK